MRKVKFLVCLLTAPLLISCGNSGSGGGGNTKGEIDFDHATPTIDVDSLSVPALTKDALGGDIKEADGKLLFDIYEVSDFHGAVNYSADDKTIGLTKMADYFSKKRAENPGGTVIISSGDMFQGSAESNLTHGYLVNYAMNIMGFEAMTLGNHEFDWSVDWIRKNANLKIGDYSIPYLGANIFDKSTGQVLDCLKPSTIITRGEYKIGVIGTLGDGAEKSIMPALIKDLEFKGEVAIVKAEAERLRSEENCDLVIWSSHRDIDDLAGTVVKTDGIDAIFGGHTHESKTKTTSDSLVPLLETKNYGKGIAHAQLALDPLTKEVTSVSAVVDEKPYEYAGLVEHAEVKKVMDFYSTYIEPIKGEVIGSTDADLDVSNTFALTNLCVDTMGIAAQKWADANGGVKVTSTYHNANGGVRADIKAGDIKFADVYRSFPFDNELVLVKTSGSKLKNYLSKAKKYGFWRNMEVLPSLASIIDTEEYYFASTDFLVTSKNEEFKLEETDLIRTGYVIRDIVAARIKYEKKVKKANFTRSGHKQYTVPTE